LQEYYFSSLTKDRVTFSTGRDIDLVPRQAGAPLDFSLYPYVEVNGQVWPKERIRFQFAFRDVEPDRADAFQENSR
jgi:hypothetical protein